MSSGTYSPQDAATNTTRNPEPFYSNEDIGILHEIVLLAQELLPNLPERERLPTNALFGAYYDILPKLGLDADHDNRYARVLFKIGGLGGPDSLYQRFESHLSKMGIEIEFEEERDETGGYDDTQEDGESVGQEQYERPQTRRRRNSESITWDRFMPLPSGQRRNSLSGPIFPPTGSPQTAQTVSPQQPIELYQNGAGDGSHEEDDSPSHNVRAWLASRPGESHRGRGRSVSTHGSLRIRRRSPQAIPRSHTNVPTTSQSVPSDEFQSPSEITAVTSAQEQTSSSAEAHFIARTDETASDLLGIKASVFRQQRLYLLIEQHLRLWRERAIQSKQKFHSLDIISRHHNRTFKLWRAIIIWKQRLVEKRKNCETEKYFKNLEHRCLIFRDLSLVHKAFSHWKALTLEEVERTSTARRHILRTRTFHAWREYTVVNEFKIRRQITKKFFCLWKRRQGDVSVNTFVALQTYNNHLVRRIYLEWAERVRSIKATAWWTVGIKKLLLVHWILALEKVQQDIAVANQQSNVKLLERLSQIWRAKTQAAHIQEQQAIGVSRAHVCLNALRKWRKERQVAPAKITVQTDINGRVLRETFAIWLHRSRQETHARKVGHLRILRKALNNWRYQTAIQLLQSRQEVQAAAVDRLKIIREGFMVWRQKTSVKLLQAHQLREAAAIDRQKVLREAIIAWREKTSAELFNDQLERRAIALDRQRILGEAWTNWRHKSRLYLINSHVNARVVREAIYKWALEERIGYASRLFRKRILHKCLEKWSQKSHASRLEGWAQEDIADACTNRKTKSFALIRWKSHTRTIHHSEVNASSFYTRNLHHGIISEWSSRTRNLFKLQQWSRDANFYFLASKSLKRWKASTQTSKRDKIKAAYAQVRRLSKITLARKLLVKWQRKAQVTLDSNAQALEMKHNKVVIHGMNIFDRWRGRAEEVVEMDSLWKEKILQKRFKAWQDRCCAFKDLEGEAINNYQERQQSQAIRRWSLLSLQQLGRSHHAVGIREKNAKKAFRKIFAYWQQRAAQRRPFHRPELDPLADTAKAEAWSDMGDEPGIDEWVKGFDEGNPSTPVPGYLSTPSRRTERVTAAAARFLSTTPRVPLSTPFERQLRAQYSGGPLSSTRRGLGRSRLGISEGFADVTSKGTSKENETT